MTTKRKENQITLPPLTHLQFAVLDALGASETSGRELRARLREKGIKKSGPAFYQLMSRLEEAKYVKGWYTEEIIDGLSRVPNLRVIARTSAFTFKGKPRDIREIGRQLNADGVIDKRDVEYLKSFLFDKGQAPLGPADVNGDDKVDAKDMFYLANYLFAKGPAPVGGRAFRTPARK